MKLEKNISKFFEKGKWFKKKINKTFNRTKTKTINIQNFKSSKRLFIETVA